MSKDLRTSVRLDTKNAISSLDKLERKIKAINNAVNKTNSRNSGLSRAISNANKTATGLSKTLNKVNTANNQAAASANKLAANYRKSNTAVSVLTKNLRTLVSTYLGIMGARAVFGASDIITSAENKLNYLNGGNASATTNTMDKTYSAAQRSRGNYGDMLTNVSKSMTLAGDAFQGNVDNAIRFQEIMSKAYTIGGASAAEQSSSMYQLIQALGAGVLQGDELRSVREGAPIAYKEIEKFAQGVYNTEESLKDLASQGKITSDMVVAAMMQAGEGIDKAFAKTDMTFAQAANSIKNMALQAFRPVLQMLNDALNSDAGKAAIEGIGNALVFLANTLLWVGDILGAFFTWCNDNWYWLQWVVMAVLTAIIAHLVIMAAQAVWAGITAFWAFITGLSPLYLWIIAIGLVVAAIVWLANNCKNACDFIILSLLAVGAVILLIGALTGSVVLMTVGLVVMAVGLLLALFMKFGQEITAGVYMAGAFIYNTVVGVINGILQFLYAMTEPFISIVEWILNAWNGGFTSFGGAVANLIGQIISWFLSLGKVVSKIVDAIFGTNWTDGLNSLQDKVLSWGKNDKAITINRDAPTLDRWAYSDAKALGMKHGAIAQDAINNFGETIQNKVAGFGVNDLLPKVALGSGSYLPNAYDPSMAVSGAYDPTKALNDIRDNTDVMADEMDLSNDDLDYLRKIAEMEWRNEFTTAEIRVDMTNNNNINSERDLDGIVSYLSDVLRDEMTSVAYGVHY